MVSVSRLIDAPKVEKYVTSGYPSSSQNFCHGGIEKDIDRKRPVGQKAAKAAKKRKPEDSMVENPINEALNNWTTTSFGANNTSLKAAREDAIEKAKIAQKDFELKEEASEVEALKLLFTRSEEDSVSYRKALKKKRLQKLLGSSTGTNSTHNHSQPTPHQPPNPREERRHGHSASALRLL